MTLAIAAEILAAFAAGLALAAATFGSLHFSILGAAISVRALSRPLVAAGLLLAARLWMARREETRAVVTTIAMRVACGALIVASMAGWLVYRSSAVGGVDSYGYVSAADRLLSGHLIQPEPLAAVMPFPEGIVAATPLGYVPAGSTLDSSAPAYPLGLPAIMAAARVIGGAAGPFWVAPIGAALLVLLTFGTARAWYKDGDVALLAATLSAVNPLVFTYAIQPMSDVPAAAAFLGAVAALSVRVPWPIAGGIAGGFALLIRPALAPAIAALALIPMVGERQRDWRTVAKYLGLIAAAVLLQGWSQRYLYGDWFGSGYGRIGGLFSSSTAATNAWIYTRWGALTFGPVWLAAVAIGLTVYREPRPRLTMASTALCIGLPYLFYRPYDHWETLRFVLPVVLLASITAAAGITIVARRAVGAALGRLGLIAVTTALAASWLSWITANNVLTMPVHEARYPLAGELVRQVTAPDAVVLALQHSGSLRYYTDRQTIDWDRIPSGALGATVAALQARGHHVYVMIDSEDERALFDARHGPVLDSPAWLPGGQRRSLQLFEAAPVSTSGR